MRKHTAFLLAALLFVASPLTANPVTEDPAEIDRTSPPGMVELVIPSHGDQMVGHAYTANGPGPHSTVIFLHGFPGNEKNLDLAQALRRAGFNTLYFHYRGAWGSAGDYSVNNITEDAAIVADFVRANAATLKADPDHISFFGHSLGGFNALFSGASDPRIQCTIAAAPANLPIMLSEAENSKDDIALGGDTVPGLKDYSVTDLFDEIGGNTTFFDVTPKMAAFKGRPLLIVSADKDSAVSLASQMPLAAAARQAGAVLDHHIMDADHSFSWQRIAFMNHITTWMEKYCKG